MSARRLTRQSLKAAAEASSPTVAPSTPKRSPPSSPTKPAKRRKPPPAAAPPPPPQTPQRRKIALPTAPLLTPHGTLHRAPDLASASAALTLTPESLLPTACAHLIAQEPRLAPLIAALPCPLFAAAGLAEPVDPWRSLASGIIAQQVSGAAAASIKRKFCHLFAVRRQQPVGAAAAAAAAAEHGLADGFPTPEEVVAVDVAQLRTAGLSQRKAEYISGLAARFVAGELGAKMLVGASYEEVVEKLVAVRGLGLWSVEMFACFGLKRMDVFSVGDLGVQRGMAAFLGKDVKKLKAKGGGKWKYLSEKEMLDYSARFAPYRSLFMWYMWRVEDVNTEVMEKA